MQITVKKLLIVHSGDIAAAVGLKDTATGDTFVMKILLFLNQWISLNQLSRSLLNLKQKLDQDKMGIALQSLQKKIQLSERKQIQKQVKQLSLVWVNFILKLLLTV